MVVEVACGAGGASSQPAQPTVRPLQVPTDGDALTVAESKAPTADRDAIAAPANPAACRRLIASADANTNQSELGGYFFSYVDRSGSKIWPVSGSDGGVFQMSEGGAEGTSHAARIIGQIGVGEVRYAGMGVNFVDPKGAFDASPYYAIAFYARRGPNGHEQARLVVPDSQTDPDGHACRECFNDFGADLALGTDWHHYIIPFASMRQQPQWGDPRPSYIDKSAIFSLQIRVSQPGATFDIWLDQIEFLACEREAPPPL